MITSHLNFIILPLLKLKGKFLHLLKLVPLFVFILLSLASCSRQKDHHMGNKFPMEIEVEAYKIKPQSIYKIVSTTGEFISPNSTVISTDVKGKIVYLDIPEGMFVKQGHLIAKIENSSNIAQSKYEKARLENAKNDYERLKKLYDEGAISKQMLDNAYEKYQTASALLEKALSEEYKYDIVAPFAGSLSLKKVSVGDFIDSGDEIVKIAQINPLNLVFSVPEKYIHDLKVGQNVTSYSESSPKMSSTISAIDPYVDQDTRTVKVQSTVPNSANHILPGAFAQVDVKVRNNPDSVLIPEESIVTDTGEKTVYIVTALNNTIPKKISTGKWEDGFVEVTSGLMIGDRVITSGHQKVFPGAMLIVSEYVPIKNSYLEHEYPGDEKE